MKYRIIILLLSLCFLSCVKENRSMCPTYLTLDLSGTPAEVETLYLILEYDDGRVFRDTIDKEGFIPNYEIAVPRGNATVAAYGNIEVMEYQGGYVIPFGRQCDNIYTSFSRGGYDSDLSYDTIAVMKNNIGLHIKVLGESRTSDVLLAELSATSIGYTNTGDLVSGKYHYVPECIHKPSPQEDYYIFYGRTPRIAGDISLSLSAYGNNGGVMMPVNLFSISILEAIAQAGVSMSDEVLQDVYLTINFSKNLFSISVEDFDSHNHVDVEF